MILPEITGLTPEQYHLQYAAAIRAQAESKPVEYWDTNAGKWGMETLLARDWSTTPHRPKAEPVTRPWSKPEDVPGPLCWVRAFRCAPVCDMIVTISQNGFIRAGSSVFTTWADAVNSYEHSTDRKTWHACVVTVPQP